VDPATSVVKVFEVLAPAAARVKVPKSPAQSVAGAEERRL
jgi:hypothetical protein